MDTLTLNEKTYVLVEHNEYKRIMKLARRRSLTTADPQPGDVDALSFTRNSIATNIIRRRKALHWTQKELAIRSGVRVETLNRAERGVTIPDVRTLQKIENAFIDGNV